MKIIGAFIETLSNPVIFKAPELTQLEKIQKHHMAKAIVDNAINKTLDEMALGPRDRTYFSSQRQRIEDAGVSQVRMRMSHYHLNISMFIIK